MALRAWGRLQRAAGLPSADDILGPSAGAGAGAGSIGAGGGGGGASALSSGGAGGSSLAAQQQQQPLAGWMEGLRGAASALVGPQARPAASLLIFLFVPLCYFAHPSFILQDLFEIVPHRHPFPRPTPLDAHARMMTSFGQIRPDS